MRDSDNAALAGRYNSIISESLLVESPLTLHMRNGESVDRMEAGEASVLFLSNKDRTAAYYSHISYDPERGSTDHGMVLRLISKAMKESTLPSFMGLFSTAPLNGLLTIRDFLDSDNNGLVYRKSEVIDFDYISLWVNSIDSKYEDFLKAFAEHLHLESPVYLDFKNSEPIGSTDKNRVPQRILL